jgi:hypothetical protein
VSSLGPLMRFIAGAAFAASQVTSAIAPRRQFSRWENSRALRNDFAAQ